MDSVTPKFVLIVHVVLYFYYFLEGVDLLEFFYIVIWDTSKYLSVCNCILLSNVSC